MIKINNAWYCKVRLFKYYFIYGIQNQEIYSNFVLILCVVQLPRLILLVLEIHVH